MPPKGKPGAAAASKEPEVEVEEGLQALVLTDVFSEGALAPISLDGPAALLPIANIPAIEYTLQFLEQQEGLSEIVLFSAKHAAELRGYLSSSRWRLHMVPSVGTASSSTADAEPEGAGKGRDQAAASISLPRLRVVTAAGANSSGDALRAVDAMAIMRSETFILVDGPAVVSNAQLGAAIAAHTARNRADTNAIMTLLMKRLPAEPAAASAVRGDARSLTRVVLNPVDGKLHAYDVLKTADALANPKLLTAIPAKVAKADPAAVALSDLLDVRVYVCSLTVLVHFSDNYDFGDVRAAYVHNEVLNVDMGFRFNAHVLTDAYAAPVVDLASYAAVSADVQRGWAYPLLPARNWAEDAARAGSSGSSHLWAPWADRGRGVLVQEGAVVHPSAVLARDVLVGAGATVAAGAFLCGSVVGPGAAVGAGARIEGSVLLGACRVGDRAAVHEAVVGTAAEVGAGATVSAGAVLGSRVQVAAGHVVPPAARLSRVPAVEGLRRERPAGDAADEPAGVGAGGRGRVWPAESEVEEEEAGESDDEEEEGEEEEGSAAAAGADGVTTLSAAASATSGLSRALAAYRSAVRASRVETDSGAAAANAGATSPAGVASALLALLAAAQAVLALPTTACGPSPAAVTEALAVLLPAVKGEATWLAPVTLQAAHEAATAAAAAASRPSPGAASAATPAAATAGKSATTAAGSAAAGAGGAAAPSAASAAEAAQARFASGVADILTSRPIAGGEDIRHVTMEVKSFKYAENRTFADCVRAVLPIVLAAVPVKLGAAAAPPGAAPATLPQFAAALDKTLALYKPMLAAFVNSIEDELAVVHAAEAYCTAPARRADYTPAFGILLNVLYQADLTSNVAVTAWVDSAEGCDGEESEDGKEGSAAPAAGRAAGAGAGSAAAADPALETRKELLATKWVQMLLARLDEEEEDDDEEDEDGDSEEEDEDDE